MKQILVVIFLILVFSGSVTLAHGPNNKRFGFGIVLGEPTGLTLKYWTANLNAFNFTLGGRSYFGSPRLGVDYLWHFYAFDTRIVNLYAGPGLAIGFGDGDGFWYEDKKGRFFVREGNDAGIGVRGVFGLNLVPENTPLEFFIEFGVLVGLAPDVGSAADFALGLRFYP